MTCSDDIIFQPGHRYTCERCGREIDCPENLIVEFDEAESRDTWLHDACDGDLPT